MTELGFELWSCHCPSKYCKHLPTKTEI